MDQGTLDQATVSQQLCDSEQVPALSEPLKRVTKTPDGLNTAEHLAQNSVSAD